MREHEFPQDEVQYDNSVSAEDAYEAAVARATRTQHALVLAEAQIISWKRRYVQAVRRAEQLEAEVVDLGGRTTTGGVEDAEGEGDGTAPSSEADCP